MQSMRLSATQYHSKMFGYFWTILVLILVIDSVVSDCPHCSSCGNSFCTRCKQSYTLNRQSGTCSPCPNTCNGCDGYNCTSCKEGRWGNTCQYTCPGCYYGCMHESGYCNDCQLGLYGTKCEYKCDLCEDKLCELRACKNGCKPGYSDYGETSECLVCPSNCRTCTNASECKICQEGFYLYESYTMNGLSKHVYCQICPSDRSSCPSYCVKQNCKTCQIQSGSLNCVECNPGYIYNGDICILSSAVCFKGCSTNCDSTGKCLGNCINGWTGETCSDLCDSKCLKCDKSDGYICQQCKGNYFTSKCNTACPSTCAKITDKQSCRIDDGYCINNCSNRSWGSHCNVSCSDGCFDNGMSQVCSRDGKCYNGCKAGFTGDKCDSLISTTPLVADLQTGSKKTASNVSSNITTTATTRTRATANKITDSSTEDNNETIIIGSAAGGAILLIVVTVLCFVKRRRKSDSRNELDENVLHSEKEAKDTRNKPLKNEPTSDAQDYIYAQPNKPRKNMKPDKDEIGGPNKLNDNVVIDLEVKQDKASNGDDQTQLENIDDETSSFIHTEVKPPTEDIYYNTESLVRSRIQVSDLFEYIRKKTDYEKEFKNLPTGLTRTCHEALKPLNKAKNRYNGIYAYDATRVVLGSTDFINANYIDGHKKSPAYIASLGPTESTMNNFVTFWEMIWQEKTEKIIMLTNLEELGKMKCEQYWPEQGTNNIYDLYKVTCTGEKKFAVFVVREFTIKRNSETRKVTQYHYTAWPDKTVPHNISSLVEFRDEVEQTVSENAGPIVVHCSAGIGRTGTYIALDIMIREGKEDSSVDIYGCVIALRGQRVHMVQNLEQYIFLHHCILYALTCEPDSLLTATIPHFFTNERISTQFQAFLKVQMLRRRRKERNKIRKENRKGADIPDDDHRVRLTLTKHDYINAVYINGYEKTDKFIAAQTPLPNTVDDFVSMLYQERCPFVVCLDEETIKDKTVGQYLPPANKVSMYGHFQVACLKTDPRANFVIRKLKISKIGSPSSEELNILHYQFKGWSSSESVISHLKPFLGLIVEIENSIKLQNAKHPVVVHCLNGADRSSLFCAVSILYSKSAIRKELSVLNTICQVGLRRPSAFQNIEQFKFCYDIVAELLEMSDTNTYCNINNV